MKGWIMLEEKNVSIEDLGAWLEKAKKFIETLPEK